MRVGPPKVDYILHEGARRNYQGPFGLSGFHQVKRATGTIPKAKTETPDDIKPDNALSLILQLSRMVEKKSF